MLNTAEDYGLIESAGRLRRELSWFGVLMLTLSSLSPVFSIYGSGAQALQMAGTGTPWVFLFGLLAAVVFGAVYAELGSAYPFAGGDYVGVGKVLGEWAGAVLMAMWLVTQGPQFAFMAQTIATMLVDIVPAIPWGLACGLILAAAVGVALLAVHASAWVTGVFLALEMVAVVVLLAAAGVSPHHAAGVMMAAARAPNALGVMAAAPIGALALAAVTAGFSTVGGNQALYFGEELHDPHRMMGRVVIVAAVFGGITIALPVIGVVISAPNLAEVLTSPVPFTEYVSQIWGRWAGRGLDLIVLLAIFNALIACVMGYARQFYAWGRDRYFFASVNRMLVRVDRGSGAPRVATLVVAGWTGVCCFAPGRILLVIFSASVVFCLGMVSLAVLVGRRAGKTGVRGFWRAPLHPIAPLLGMAIAGCFAAADWMDPAAGRPSIIVLAVVCVVAAVWREIWCRRVGR